MTAYVEEKRDGLFELTEAAKSELISSKYYNKDLAPTSVSERTWTTYNITSLWIGMAICVPAFTMASSLVALGVSPWLAVLNVTLGNILVLIPILLNSHAGTKYGLPFPAYARSVFGTFGAHIPALSRGITACGWCAIQSWIGGGAIVTMIGAFVPSILTTKAEIFGVSAPSLICFLIFLAIVGVLTAFGMNVVNKLETIGVPVLILIAVGLFVWSLMIGHQAGAGFGEIIQSHSDQVMIGKNGGFWFVFLAGLTANISFWSTMALNITDFSRYAKNQKAQFQGQLYGLPTSMFACAFIGAFFAQSTKIANITGTGEAVFDPTVAIHYVDNNIIKFVVSIAVVIATVTTVIASDVVAPANVFSNLSPKRISFAVGVGITCIISIAFRPWWIFSGAGAFIFEWLNVYGGILAPIAAIFIVDYFLVKRKQLDVMEIYADKGKKGKYWYQGGFNLIAIVAWICGCILPTLGSTILKDADMVHISFFEWCGANGYFVGFLIGGAVYWLLMMNKRQPKTVQ